MSIKRRLLRVSLGFVVIVGASGCSSKSKVPQLAPEEPGEDPIEEQSETAIQEQGEESIEVGGEGGSMAMNGSGGEQGVSFAGGQTSSGGDATGASGSSSTSGGTFGGGQANSGGVAGAVAASGSGGAPTSSGGMGGTDNVGSGGAASGASGVSGAGGSIVSYPMLNASDLGRPTQIPASVRLTLAEGPLWDPCQHRLLFVDVSASTIYSLANGQISVVATNTNYTNGIAFAPDGSLVLAQMGRPGHVSRLDKSGTITPLDPPGSRLHTPDDVIVRSDGVIYFTDGDFPPVGGVDLTPLPVYALLPGASQLSNGGTVPGPNGIELSPDEKTLYVDAYFAGSVVKFSVQPDGTISKGPTLATGLSNPDSLCIDAAGNLYVAVSSGLQVLRPDGTRVALISVPVTTGVTNCAFGGDDGKTLYITAWTTIWQLPGMPIPGLEWTVNRQRLGCM
jgi:gluconolactonase